MRLRLRLRQTPRQMPRQTPRQSDAPPDAPTRLETRNRQAMPGFVLLRHVNNHGTSRSYLPRNTDVRRFGALPAIFALLHHHIHTPQQGHTSHVPFTAHSTTAGSAVPPHETAKPAIPETTKSGTAPSRICRQNKPHPHSNTHPFPSDYAGTPRSARFLYTCWAWRLYVAFGVT